MLTFTVTQGLENCPDSAAIRHAIIVVEEGYEDPHDQYDPTGYHAVAYLDGLPVATGRAYHDEGSPIYHIGRVGVLKEHRGKHLGIAIMRQLEEKVRQVGGKQIDLSAKSSARTFYEQLGYRLDGEEYTIQGCPHVNMTKAL